VDGNLLMIATIQAANGVMDFLKDVFAKGRSRSDPPKMTKSEPFSNWRRVRICFF